MILLTTAAAPTFHDGPPVAGACAMAQAGYQPTPRAGRVFYGRVVLSGACAPAELEVIPPAGAIVADTDRFPIKCFVQDAGGVQRANPVCPTHTVDGTYGPRIPAGDGGGDWQPAPGQALEVDVPLVSARALKGGACPEDVDALGSGDCLAFSLRTGGDQLLPSVPMLTGPPRELGLSTFATTTRPRLRARGLRVTLTVPFAGDTATLTLRQGRRTLARVTRRHLRAGDTAVRLRLSPHARLHRGKVVLVERISRPARTLRLTVAVR
jgi:hypothetical protein